MDAMHYPQPQQQWGPPRPQKNGIGCLGVGLIVLAVGVLGTMGLCGAIVASGHRSPEERAKDDEVAAAAASAQAAAAASAEAALEPWKIKTRKACGLKPGDEIFPATVRKQLQLCRVLVEGGLKVPGSGEFPDLPSETETSGLSTVDGCRSFIDTYVDAKNAFGVKVRTRYRCTYDPTTGLPSFKNL